MINRISLITLILMVISLMSFNQTAIAADRMTYEEYQSQLKGYQDREAKAKSEIDVEKQKIEDLRKQIADLEAQIASVWDQIFAALGITRDEYEKFNDEIVVLEGRVSSLEQLSPERLLDRAEELDELESQVEEMEGAPQAKISVVKDRLASLAARIERLKKSLPKPKHDMYTVVRGDHLWKISGKPQIFGDPWKWMRIYSVNRDQIRNPDLIYPDQRLSIPRQIGRDQHLVQKGDYLSKIAGYREVYGDPFKWTKIYQANKDNGFIQDPNLIYPEQILSIPQN